MNLQELLKAWIINQRDINEYNQTWSFSKATKLKVDTYMNKKSQPVVYNINWKQLSQDQVLNMSKTIEDKFKNWEITKSEYNSYKKQLENEVYWQKQNEQQNNKLTSEWNTNWKILVNWKLEFPNEINTKKEEPITQKEEPITKYEYNPNDAEMQQALERAKLTNQAYFDRVKWEYTQDYERAKLDIDRLIQYTNTDYAKNLANENKMFARSLDKATNVYWQRWLLWSWIQKSKVWEATDDYTKSLQNAEEYRRRKIEWYETQWQNLKTKYDRWMWDLMRWEEAQITSDYLKLMEANKQKFYWNVQWAETDYFMDFLKNQWVTTQTTPYNQKDVLNKNTF